MSEKQQSPDGGEVVVEVGRERRSKETKGSKYSAKSFRISVVSKPKSRFGDTLPIMYEETGSDEEEADANCPNRESPKESSLVSLVRNESPSAENGEDEEVYKTAYLRVSERRRMSKKIWIEWGVFLSFLGCLVASLTVPKLKSLMVSELEIWKWCALVMVVSCSMLMTNWVMQFIIVAIERGFRLRNKVLFFVDGMKKSVQIVMWASLVLVTWLLLIKRGLQQSKVSSKIVAYITRSMFAVVIGAFLWLLKTLLVLILASKFEAVTYFDRIQESISHQYCLQALSGPPLMEEASSGTIQLSFRNTRKEERQQRLIDMTELRMMKQKKVSSWTLKGLVDVVTSSGLTTIFHSLEDEGIDKEITSEMEATAAAYDIFRNVAPPGAKYIEQSDLLRFMTLEEVDVVWPLIDVAMTGQVDRKNLRDWVVKVYTGRKALALALSDTKAVTAQVDNLVTSIVFIIIIVVSLLVVEIATTSFFVFLSSQLVSAAFSFGNTCKNVFESIMFLFVAHPYDVGDCIGFEGIPMIVEEMNVQFHHGVLETQ